MTRKEYLDSLSGKLGTMSYNDVKEIIADIDAHFEEGLASGKTEEEISKGLGDPRDLAIAYMDGNETMINNVLNRNKDKQKQIDKMDKEASGPLFVVLFNVFVGIPAWVVLFFVSIVLAVVDLGLVAAIVALAIKIPATGAFMPGLILLDISMFFTVIFLTCMLYFLFKLFFKGTGKYISWNRKVWNEGF